MYNKIKHTLFYLLPVSVFSMTRLDFLARYSLKKFKEKYEES